MASEGQNGVSEMWNEISCQCARYHIGSPLPPWWRYRRNVYFPADVHWSITDRILRHYHCVWSPYCFVYIFLFFSINQSSLWSLPDMSPTTKHMIVTVTIKGSNRLTGKHKPRPKRRTTLRFHEKTLRTTMRDTLHVFYSLGIDEGLTELMRFYL